MYDQGAAATMLAGVTNHELRLAVDDLAAADPGFRELLMARLEETLRSRPVSMTNGTNGQHAGLGAGAGHGFSERSNNCRRSSRRRNRQSAESAQARRRAAAQAERSPSWAPRSPRAYHHHHPRGTVGTLSYAREVRWEPYSRPAHPNVAAPPPQLQQQQQQPHGRPDADVDAASVDKYGGPRPTLYDGVPAPLQSPWPPVRPVRVENDASAAATAATLAGDAPQGGEHGAAGGPQLLPPAMSLIREADKLRGHPRYHRQRELKWDEVRDALSSPAPSPHGGPTAYLHTPRWSSAVEDEGREDEGWNPARFPGALVGAVPWFGPLGVLADKAPHALLPLDLYGLEGGRAVFG